MKSHRSLTFHYAVKFFKLTSPLAGGRRLSGVCHAQWGKSQSQPHFDGGVVLKSPRA